VYVGDKNLLISTALAMLAEKYKNTVLPHVNSAYSPFKSFLRDFSTSQIFKDMRLLCCFASKRGCIL
jgi:hypothetical protein